MSSRIIAQSSTMRMTSYHFYSDILDRLSRTRREGRWLDRPVMATILYEGDMPEMREHQVISFTVPEEES